MIHLNRSNKEIKYGDYITLSWTEETDLKVDFLDYLEFFLASNYRVFDNHILNNLSLKKIPKRDTNEIIEGMIPSTLKERETKSQNKNYYICHAACAAQTIKSIFNVELLNYLRGFNVPPEIIERYSRLLEELLSDVDQLINLFQCKIKGNNAYPSNIENRFINFSSLHTILRQILHGNNMPNPSIESSVSISLIRQIIEIRLRRAFGTMSYIDDNFNVVPLDMSSLFQVLKRVERNIEFPLKLSTIERIYKWANMSVHTGKDDFVWIPYYVEKQFSTLSFGHVDKMLEEGWQINNGIKTTENIIHLIHQQLVINKELKILKCRPECQIVTSVS